MNAQRSRSKRPPQKRLAKGKGRSGSGGRGGLAGDHIEGRQAVRELLLAGRRRTHEVILADGLDAAPILDDIVQLADELRVKVTRPNRATFDSVARTDSSQGVVALAAPIQEVELADLVRPANGVRPFLLVLDGITDPGNLGAILRTAECAGVTGVVLPRHRAAHITPTVAKAAAGAVEHLDFAVAPGLPAAMRTMQAAGVWTVGLDASGATQIHDLAVADEPIALVLGAEGSGLSRLVAERCDALACVPLKGVLASLNVSAAAAVACFEISRRREARAQES